MIGSKIIAALGQKYGTVFCRRCQCLLPICCHFGLCMPYLHIFAKEIVALSSAMADKEA